MVAAAIAGCSPSRQRPPEPTVAVRDVPGHGTILVDRDGSTLYVSDEERGGFVRCVAECATVWPPLTIPPGEEPVAGEGVTGQLGTITRADGNVQVTYDGRPLYLYSLDTGPDIAKGDGLTEQAGDTTLTWHVATPGRAPAPSAAAG